MTFKGIPINGSLSSFVSNLKSKGFTLDLIEDGLATLKGDFAGKSNCTIVVVATEQSNTVWKVVVFFPEKTSWYSLKSEYESFKESYTEKYGNPESYEFFSNPYYEGDGYELQALTSEKCRFVSYYQTDKGYITVEVHRSQCLLVSYEDAINVTIKIQEEEMRISEDI
jgi:outer membrane protein assembly factor BamA